MLEQEGSLSSLCTDAEKERGLPGEQSAAAAAAAAETAIESMLERTTGAAVHISTDYRGCSEHCVTECTDIMSSLSGQLCINQLEEKNTGCGIINTSNGEGEVNLPQLFSAFESCVCVCVCVCVYQS